MGAIRKGHTRPEGTTWRMRLHSWSDRDRQPHLGDLVYESPYELERAFEVVGIEETRVPTTFRLTLERISWRAFHKGILERPHAYWAFTRDRR